MGILVAALLLFNQQAQTPPPKLDLTRVPLVDSYLERLSGFGYSGSFLIVKGDKVLLNKGYGYADREAKVPCADDTVYDIGSFSKQFTATAILKLEEDGKLKISQRIGDFLKGVPEDKRAITIEQLLMHQGGLGPLNDTYSSISRGVIFRDQMVAQILAMPLRSSPGSRNDYSNEGYRLLAAIVEKASGMPFRNYLRQKLFGPAGLRDTGWWGTALAKVNKRQLAKGYDWDEVRQDLQQWSGETWNSLGSGGMTSSARDLWTWFKALRSGKIISRKTLDRMWTARAFQDGGARNYGYGWWVITSGLGLPLIYHGGDGWASGMMFRYYPTEDLVILGLANVRHDLFPTEMRASGAAPMILWDRPHPEPPSFDRNAVTALKDALGTYRLSSGGELIITEIDGQLYVGAKGQNAIDAIDPTQGGELKLRNELNDFALRVFRGAEAGDFTAMNQTVIPPVAQMFRDGWKGESAALSKGLGKPIGITCLGTYLSGMTSLRNTLLEFQYENGKRNYLVRWDQNKIFVEGTTEAPKLAALMPLQPANPSKLVGWDLKMNRGVQIEIIREAKGPSGLKVAPLESQDWITARKVK